ncbi:cellulose biosynthesis protein BcsO [Paramixta manurensis]|uniref:Cellulose biosynthesis protein BcsO n=1 Tax=Paramixta manurensis TaxID=2740817 RepID=A0A6M8UEB5_9GAMM|nr:cellulose biosynthesis protein BcsO [Erwiniaceae bacterium PD-1]
MKSYDDLQRFKDKTQTQGIDFKDMSEQTLESDTTHWAIIKQLLQDGTSENVLERSQPIDQSLPQPIAEDLFAALPAASPGEPEKPAPGPAIKPLTTMKPFAAVTSSAETGGSLLASVAASLKPAAERPINASTSVPPPVSAQPARPEATRPSFPPEARAAAASVTPRYQALFRARNGSGTGGVSKDSLLKPLLEKIALCR